MKRLSQSNLMVVVGLILAFTFIREGLHQFDPGVRWPEPSTAAPPVTTLLLPAPTGTPVPSPNPPDQPELSGEERSRILREMALELRRQHPEVSEEDWLNQGGLW